MKTFLLCLLLVGCNACHSIPTSTDAGKVPLTPPPDAADAGVALDACALGCRHLRALGCPDGAHTPGGATCETVCRASLPPTGGVDPKCLRTIKTCDQESTCTVH